MFRTLPSVFKAELRHQRFLIQQGRVGVIWIVLAALLLIPAGLAALHYMRLLWMGAEDVFEVAQGIVAAEGVWVGALLVGSISLYAVVTLITYGLAANSILRERRGRTWDSLRLTHAPTWQILLGKWLASLRAVLGDHAMSILLQMGLISLAGLLLPALMAEAAPPSPIKALVAWGWMLAAGLLDAGLSAALGVVSALPEGAASAVAGLLLLAVRIVVSVGVLAWSAWIAASAPIGGVSLAVLGCAIYLGLIGAALWVGGWQLR